VWDRIRANLVERRVPLAIGIGLYLVTAFAFYRLRGDAGYWTIDDAGITYAASLQLVDHGSLATSFGGPPIEGYSNPLLFFLVALLHVFGLFDPITTHVLLEALVFAAMVGFVWSMLRGGGEIAAIAGAIVFVVVQLATPATWVWYGSGLENVWVSAGLVAMLWLCLRTARGVPLSHRWGTLLFAIAITRPEAPVYVAACFLTLATVARPDGDYRAHLRRVIRAAIVTAALFVVFLAWRRIAYGEWLPNTYYAKMHERHIGDNVRDYVVRGILPYTRAGMFAMSALVLLVVPKLDRAAMTFAIFLVASLALPIAAGADWMGEHRFATPFLAVAHVAYAMLFAWSLARLVATRPRAWPAAHVVAFLGIALVAGLLRFDRNALMHRIVLNDVTVGRIAYLEGGLRWEQQMRLGLPYPVVLMPDAGGSMLVGGAQMVDNGVLTDYQIARMGRDYRLEGDKRELFQYQAERDPDLVTIDEQFWFDRSVLGTKYVMPPGGMEALKTLRSTVLAARNDLVEATPEGTELGDGVRVSPETVLAAAPGALVRIELIVPNALTGTLRATIEGDHDELALQAQAFAFQRVALLVGAPPQVGTHVVTIALGEKSLGTVAIAVTDLPVAATTDADPWRAARRSAWSQEQRVPRLRMTAFRALVRALDAADRTRSPDVGGYIMTLRHNARFVEKQLDRAHASRLFALCNSDVVCIGRTVDRLRRLGYLNTAQFVRDDLDNAVSNLQSVRGAQRYRLLVGLVLARPDDLFLQRELLAERAALKTASYPQL
jgi:hypothetical protein